MLRAIAFGFLLIVSSCERVEAERAPAGPAVQEQVRPIALFPGAAEVRVFANADGFRLGDDARELPIRRADGATLDDVERATVTNAISIGPMPDAITDCACIWRHVFVFYDSQGVELGALALCLECHCAEIVGAPSLGRPVSMHQYRWNSADIVRIIQRHGLQVEALDTQ
jgi:hypothetical protein